MSILEELKWRGLVADCTDAAELDKKVSAPITLYCGFDPTADSLHVGNLVPLLALRRFQLLGHHPIAVAGGATGSIGDPSGKTQERQLLTKEVLDRNIASVKEQLKRLLDFETKTNPARLVDNASWTANVSFLDFLRDIGKHFSVNQMVAKESVRARMEDREVGISYTEFSYMLLQAFDFMVLCRESRTANCKSAAATNGATSPPALTSPARNWARRLTASRCRSSPTPTARNSARPRPAPSGSIRNAPASITFTSSGSTPMTATSSAT